MCRDSVSTIGMSAHRACTVWTRNTISRGGLRRPMGNPRMTHDLIVLGAGIAGSSVAKRLCAAGRRVALVGGESRRGWEGLSNRSRALLLSEGVAADVLGPASAPPRGGWGERNVEGQEWIVERWQLAASLRVIAATAGADLVRSWANAISPMGEGWQVHLRDGRTIAAPWLIDACGRRGAERRGPALLAVSRAFYRT